MVKKIAVFSALSISLLGIGCYCESSDEIIAKYHQEHPMNPTRDSLVGFWKRYQDARSSYDGYGAKYNLRKKNRKQYFSYSQADKLLSYSYWNAKDGKLYNTGTYPKESMFSCNELKEVFTAYYKMFGRDTLWVNRSRPPDGRPGYGHSDDEKYVRISESLAKIIEEE